MSPRPRSENSKCFQVHLRMTKETLAKLNECAGRLGISKTEVIERGIDLVKSELDKK